MRRVVSLLLCLIMTLQLLPVTALGAESLEELRTEKNTAVAALVSEIGRDVVSDNFSDRYDTLKKNAAACDTAIRAYYKELKKSGVEDDDLLNQLTADETALAASVSSWRNFQSANNSYYSVPEKVTALIAVGGSVDSLWNYLLGEKALLTLPESGEGEEEEVDNALTQAWNTLESAYTAYYTAESAVYAFRDKVLDYIAMAPWENNVYNWKYDTGKDTYGNEPTFHTVKLYFSWTTTHGTPHNRTDSEQNYIDLNNAVATESAAAREMLVKTTMPNGEMMSQLAVRLNNLKHMFESFYEQLDNASIEQMREWKAVIDDWKAAHDELYAKYLGNTDSYEDVRYSLQLPLYGFDSTHYKGSNQWDQYLFHSMKKSTDGLTYMDNALELAYYCDSEYNHKTNERIALCSTAQNELWAEGKIGALTLAKLQAEIENVDRLERDSTEMRQAWIEMESNALWNAVWSWEVDGKDVNGTNNFTEAQKNEALTKLTTWKTKAVRYFVDLHVYMSAAPNGRAAYLGQKFQALRDSYAQDYVIFEELLEKAQAGESATGWKAYRVELLAARVEAVGKLLGQLRTYAASGEETELRNPYTDEELGKIPDARMGLSGDNVSKEQRKDARCAYLRSQVLELTVWHDVSAKAVETTRDALNLTDRSWLHGNYKDKNRLQLLQDGTAYSPEIRYDLKEAIAQWQAYAAYTGELLAYAEEAYENYSKISSGGIGDIGSGSGSGSGNSRYYQEAVEELEKASRAYEVAQETTAAKQQAVDEAQISGVGYDAAVAALAEAQQAEQTAKEALERAEEFAFTVLVGSGYSLAESEDFQNWEQAYRQSMLAAAEAELTAAQADYTAAAAATQAVRTTLTAAESDVRKAELARGAAMDAYSQQVTALVEAKANLTQKEKEYGSSSTEYAEAKAAYDAVDAKVTEANIALKAASNVYNTAVAAKADIEKNIQALQATQDEKRTAQTQRQEEVNRWQQQVDDKTSYFESVPMLSADEAAERYTLDSLQQQINETSAAAKEAEDAVKALYEELRSEGFAYTGTAEQLGAKIYEFRRQLNLLEGYRNKQIVLEEAIGLQYDPNTLDGAIAAAKQATAEYFYAQRDYDQFTLLESRLIGLFDKYDPTNLNSTFLSGGAYSIQVGIYPYETDKLGSASDPEAHALLMAGKALKKEYASREAELVTAVQETYAEMQAKLKELSRQELNYERHFRTAEEVTQRADVLKKTRDDAKSAYDGYFDTTHGLLAQMQYYITSDLETLDDDNGFYLQIKKAVYNIAASRPDSVTEDSSSYKAHYTFAEDMGAINETINVGLTRNAYDDSGDDVLVKSEWDLWNWLYVYSKEDCANSFVNYQLAEAMYSGMDEARNALINRINKMGDQYALQVSTQASGGSGILFFSVVYTDVDGFERREYIFPFLDAYDNTLAEAAYGISGGDSSAEVDVTKAVNQDHIKTMASLGQAGSIKATTPLSPWSSDTFLFRTQYKMGTTDGCDAVDHFEMFVQRQTFKDSTGKVSSAKKNEWSCSNMRVFKVDNCYGMSVYGYGGGPHTQTQLEFSGSLLAYLERAMSGATIAWVTDDMISLGDEGDDLYTVHHLNETDGDNYHYRTGKVSEESGVGNLVKVPDADSEYLIKLDFADHYGAGIEGLVNQVQDTSGVDPTRVEEETGDSLNNTIGTPIDPDLKTPLSELGLTECLMLRLVYKDKNGARRQVEVPVISSSIAWAIDHPRDGKDISDAKIFGYAQQGTSIVLSAYLPEMEELSLTESSLVFQYVDWTDWKEYTTASPAVQSRVDGRKTLIQQDEQIELSGIQIYEPGSYTADAYVEQGVVKYDIAHKTAGGGPRYMITADRLICPAAAAVNLGILYPYQNDTDTPLKRVKTVENTYMLVIQTDEMPLAGSASMPTVDLNYVTSAGRSKTVSSSVEQEGLDFYGYWPGVGDSNVTATQAMGAGGQLKLLYTVEDLGTFESVRIQMPETLDDDWQIKGLYLQRVNAIGERFGVWENIFRDETFITDRRYDRLIDATTLTDEIDGPVLLQPGDSKIITFENSDTPTVEDEEIDWEKFLYYMDEETAQSALGFTKARETYTIRVQVNDEGASTISDGDCGSVNNFYFQLVFANGRSAYVLANQQLSGDGFRTGYIETFTIKTNRDYGELQAVRIIPDDNSSDSELFDKLNIKRIRVSRNSDDSVSRTWVVTDIGDNGWISFDYHDDAESYGLLGRPGRAEAEIAVNCPVSYVTYSTKLLFALSTGPSSNDDVEKTLAEMTEGVEDPDKVEKIREVLNADLQYQGQLSMILYYHNIKGNVEAMTVDVVGAMATYANKVADKEEQMDANGNVITGSQYMSNKEYMFRVGRTDRFELDITDVKDLVSVDLIPTGSRTQSAFWNVASLSVHTLSGSGILNLNTNNEYEKTNAQSGELLCSALGMPFTYWCPAANPEKMSFSFSENALTVKEEDSDWEVVPARVPESGNDTANIYVYGIPDFRSTAGAEYNKLFTQLQYTTVYGQVYKAPLREMVQYTTVDGGTMFFTAGVDIANMAVLNGVSMLLNSNQNSMVVDKVVVQQIRSGVVVATYTMVPPAGNAKVTDKAIVITPNDSAVSGTVYDTGRERQLVTVGFGPGTDAARLISQNRDVGIALKYTSTNDVAEGGKKPEYTSPYIYLTDQDIVAISNGATPQIIFHEQDVDEVLGLVAVATGGLKATITAASVQMQVGTSEGTTWTYANREGNYWFSVVETLTLSTGAQTVKVWKPQIEGVTEQTVSPLTVTVTTGSQVPTGAIKMTVDYKKMNGTTGQLVVGNIRSNLVSGGFNAGQSATIRVMLGDNVESVEKITLSPVQEDVTWIITSLDACLERTGQRIVTEGNGTPASAGAPAVFQRDATSIPISFNVTASTVDVSGLTHTVSTEIGGAMSLSVGPGQTVDLAAALTGNDGEEVMISAEVESGGQWLDVSSNLTRIEENHWSFVSRLGEDAVYRITLTPSLHPSQAVTVTINYKTTVVQPGLNLNIVNLTLSVGTGRFQLLETGGREVTWSSSDPSVAAVNADGWVSAQENAGPASSAIITATATDGSGDTATCLVTFR